MNAIIIPLTLTFIAAFAFLPPRVPKPGRSSERKDEAMKREEFELLIELAIVVHQLAPPDSQRSISRKIDAMEAAARHALNNADAALKAASKS